ncbi:MULTISPECIES: hypothetical protein [Bacteroidales]|jgi:hypothetical protein|uniref:hypothetical protein n=1 Tax=Bacteroidales TaxID=171549 RepID=UPI000D144C33|nr:MULTISPECIES: hypothetical protein [Bacteroidales]PWB10494.1 hypothetical protein C5O72_06795 [Muribaculum intestinale]
MSQIENKNTPTFDIDHIYIVDRDDDNAKRRMLLEAFVKKVSISKEGTVKFYFQLAGESGTIESDLLKIYYDVATYRSEDKVVKQTYQLISELLNELGIPSVLFDCFKAHITSSQFLIPKGFIINDNLMIEPIDFPESWDFERSMQISENNGVKTVSFSDWTHNANFKGKPIEEIYPTREEALKDHQIKVLRLTGKEDEV